MTIEAKEDAGKAVRRRRERVRDERRHSQREEAVI
jgi:hypothetical protein